jgi:hypothetical protein
MSKLIVNGAQLSCSQGTSPSSLTVLPALGTTADEQPAATVMDYVPMVNVAPFGMCQTQANPEVAAATAAAMGTPTPMPCIPALSSPWSPGASIVTIHGKAALSDDSTCKCMWTGSISITPPGQAVEVK